MKYTVYFELFGKKMRTTIEAKTPAAARNKIREKIKFHKIEEEPGFEDILKKFFNL